MSLFIEPIYWSWLILAGIFLVVEVVSTTLFFLFWASAALIMAAINFALPRLSWQIQLSCFAVLTIMTIFLWWKFARRWQDNPNDTAGKLNNRGRNLLGRQFILPSAIEQHYGHLKIDDTLWMIYCDEDLPAGSKIVIDDIDSLTLKVSRVG